MLSVNLIISGKVQGVGFRIWTREQALKLNITGWVKNLTNGNVQACLNGTEQNINELIKLCHIGPKNSHVLSVVKEVNSLPNMQYDNFSIIK